MINKGWPLVPFLILTSGCQWFEKDLLEVYFGINSEAIEIDADTRFPYPGNESLTFEVGRIIHIRLDFLFMPNKDSGEPLEVKLNYPDVEAIFLVPGGIAELVTSTDETIFTYHLPVVADSYTTFYFAIEVTEPTTFQIELASSIEMSHVSDNALNVPILSSEATHEIVSKGKTITFNELIFVAD